MTKKKIARDARHIAIQSVLLGFDFPQVHQFMRLSNWTWIGGVPTVLQLKETAAALLHELVFDPEVTACDTGGLRAERIYSLEGVEQVRLSFEASSFSASWPDQAQP